MITKELIQTIVWVGAALAAGFIMAGATLRRRKTWRWLIGQIICAFLVSWFILGPLLRWLFDV